MNIALSYAKKTASCELEARGRLRLYAVPTEYSADGLYLAAWGPGSMEPVPACDGAAVTLLADLERCESGLLEHFCARGVKYAES